MNHEQLRGDDPLRAEGNGGRDGHIHGKISVDWPGEEFG